MRVRAAAVLLALAAIGAAQPAEDAQALSCAPPNTAAYRVVFDGVMLSGPREEPLGRLASPARMHVFRYLRGRGPREIAVGTDVPLVTPGDDPGSYSEVPGLFEPHPGDVYRVYADVPKGAGSSTRLGVLTPGACGGTHLLRAGTYLRGQTGSRVAVRDPGGRRWAAEYLRARGGVRCVRVHPGHAQDALECDRLRSPGQVLAALVPAGGQTWATALAVSRPGLESVVVEGPFGRIEERAKGTAALALVVVPGYFERSDMTVTARLAGGAEVAVPGFGEGVLLPDPNRPGLQLGIARQPAQTTAPGTACVTFAGRPDTGKPGDAFSAPRYGECGPAGGGFFAVRHMDRYGEDDQRRRYATLVFGVAPPGVGRVTIAGPGGERDATLGRGGVFGAAYPPDVEPGDLTITFHARDGASSTFAGQRDWQVTPPPRSELDRGYWSGRRAG
jgi:hypothetical protein